MVSKPRLPLWGLRKGKEVAAWLGEGAKAGGGGAVPHFLQERRGKKRG